MTTGLFDLLNTSLGLLIALILVFGMVVHPIWCIVDCALATDKSKASKVFWVLALFFLSCFAAVFYGLFASHSRGLRRATYGSFVGLLLGIPAFFYTAWQLPNKPVKANYKTTTAKAKKPMPQSHKTLPSLKKTQ